MLGWKGQVEVRAGLEGGVSWEACESCGGPQIRSHDLPQVVGEFSAQRPRASEGGAARSHLLTLWIQKSQGEGIGSHSDTSPKVR